MLYKMLFLLLIPAAALSQKVIDVGTSSVFPVRDGLFYVVAGTPFSSYKYVKVVTGTPYFNQEYVRGSVFVEGGGEIRNLPLKLDLLSGDLLYKDSTDQELVATTAVRQVVLTDPATGSATIFLPPSSLSPRGNEPGKGWYQLLESGKATLYKKTHKIITEYTPFNSATTEQTINSSTRYFLVIDNSVILLKKLKDAVDLLGDKKDELRRFIADNKLTGKTDSDFSSTVAYYNTLLLKK